MQVHYYGGTAEAAGTSEETVLGDEERSKTGTVHTKSTCGVFSGANVPLIDPATHCVVRDP